MNIKHLHLHVRDRAVAEAFYTKWLDLRVDRRFENLTFMRDDSGFDLALMEESDPAKMPDWFHFGAKLDSAETVEALHEQMKAASVPIAKPLYRDDSIASFRFRYPDGYSVEVYWE